MATVKWYKLTVTVNRLTHNRQQTPYTSEPTPKNRYLFD
jgi:hypothetical protein